MAGSKADVWLQRGHHFAMWMSGFHFDWMKLRRPDHFRAGQGKPLAYIACGRMLAKNVPQTVKEFDARKMIAFGLRIIWVMKKGKNVILTGRGIQKAEDLFLG